MTKKEILIDPINPDTNNSHNGDDPLKGTLNCVSNSELPQDTPTEHDLTGLELSDIIDTSVLQSLMNDFYRLTGMLGAILDVSGKVLVAVGWQKICTSFHRCHPDTERNCIESDTILSSGVQEGTYKAYQCKNHMWDMVTPLVVGGKHMGNVFIGQFFYTDEIPDRELFRKQAQLYGFPESEYMEALDRVPKFSRETVNNCMNFYSNLARIISSKSLSSLLQSRLLAERKLAVAQIEESEKKFRTMTDNSPLAIYMYAGAKQKAEYVNPTFTKLFGYTLREVPSLSEWWLLAYPNEKYRKQIEDQWGRKIEIANQNNSTIAPMETIVTCKDGSKKTISWRFISSNIQSWAVGQDLTKRKQAEKKIQDQLVELQRWFNVTEGRENRVIELKNEVNILRQRLGEPPKYISQPLHYGGANSERGENE